MTKRIKKIWNFPWIIIRNNLKLVDQTETIKYRNVFSRWIIIIRKQISQVLKLNWNI